jgi:hypothetical protein
VLRSARLCSLSARSLLSVSRSSIAATMRVSSATCAAMLAMSSSEVRPAGVYAENHARALGGSKRTRPSLWRATPRFPFRFPLSEVGNRKAKWRRREGDRATTTRVRGAMDFRASPPNTFRAKMADRSCHGLGVARDPVPRIYAKQGCGARHRVAPRPSAWRRTAPSQPTVPRWPTERVGAPLGGPQCGRALPHWVTALTYHSGPYSRSPAPLLRSTTSGCAVSPNSHDY